MVQRRIFSPEFKAEAVRLVHERGVTVAQAARDLSVHANVLRKWVGTAKPAVKGPSILAGGSEPAELVRLRREIAQLKTERDLLKKAAAYFAKDQL
jgi:transposase